MSFFKSILSRLGVGPARRKFDQEMGDEMRSHLDLSTKVNIEAGMDPEEARRAAARKFGLEESIKETCREKRGFPWLDNLIRDTRFGFRQLWKNPGFASIAVLTLALGIGATTAIFSVVYGVLISPYPYAKPGEIWAPGVMSVSQQRQMRPYRLSEYLQMAKLPVFSEVMATGPGNVLMTGEFAPETVRAVLVSGNAFEFLGVKPVFGRGLQPSDIRSTGEPELVTVLSFKRWQRLYGSDTNILGKKLILDDEPYTIVGVMPSRFGWWTDDGLWVPLGTDSRYQGGVFPIAHLAAGTTPPAAKQALNVLQQEMAKVNPGGFPKEEFQTLLTNYLDMTQASGTMQHSLQLLFAAVGFLLLIACANAANLQLARASARAREMATRLAIGAGRGQLVRQLLVESLMISILGGVLGLLFSYWITNLVVALMPGFYLPNESRIQVNTPVLVFCLGISMLIGILFGLAPALQSTRVSLVGSLKDGAQASIGGGGGRARAILVIGQVALSVVLLVSAGLTIRSFLALQGVELGFQPESVVTLDLPLAPKHYTTFEQRNRMAREVIESVRTLPTVIAATIGNGGLPFAGPDSTYSVENEPASESRTVAIYLADWDYLKTLGIPLRRGRSLSRLEVESCQPVAVINEAALKLWPAGVDPIGRTVKLYVLSNPGAAVVLTPTNATSTVTVVGVMGDTRNDDLQHETKPAALIPYTLLAPPGRTLAVRSSGDPRALMTAVRAKISSIDRVQPLIGPTTLREIIEFRTAQPRFITVLFSLFASIALALVIAGIYGVLSYLVARRTREIGLRIALGAPHFNVLALIFKAAGKLIGIGLLIGILGAIAAAQVLRAQLDLFLVQATDAVSFCAVIGLLIVVAAAATFIPARRAAKVDPMVALRSE